MKSPRFRPATLIFDLGNVIVRYNQIDPSSALVSKSINGYEIVRSLVPGPYAGEIPKCYEKGQLSSEEFFQIFKRDAGYSDSFDAFAKEFCEDYHFALDEEVYDIINSIKLKYCGEIQSQLLSNINRLHYEHINKKKPGVFSNMRRVHLSFLMGVRKPEPEIFQMALEASGWKTGYNCLFIDDIEENVAAAKKLGFDVILYENANELKKSLKRREIEV